MAAILSRGRWVNNKKGFESHPSFWMMSSPYERVIRNQYSKRKLEEDMSDCVIIIVLHDLDWFPYIHIYIYMTVALRVNSISQVMPIASWHQAITRSTTVDFSIMMFIHLRVAISPWETKLQFCIMSLKFMLLKLQPGLPGAIELSTHIRHRKVIKCLLWVKTYLCVVLYALTSYSALWYLKFYIYIW